MAVVETSYSELPMTGGSKVKEDRPRESIPGWDTVEPFRQESLYWGRIWAREGRPSTGWLNDTYRKKQMRYHYAVRQAKRNREKHQAEGLLAASVQGDTELLKAMKSVRKGKPSCEDLHGSVGGADGPEEIAEKFKSVYEALYTGSDTVEEMDVLKKLIASQIKPDSVNVIQLVTGGIVKYVITKMKAKKSDVSGSFVSDALHCAPDAMFELLAAVFRSWLSHGSITPSLLACSFLPLLKSTLKDPGDTASYRAIAGSALLLKLFELIVLELWGHHMTSDSLQFGFKANTSTTHCTWLVTEVVQHLLHMGTNPIITVLDCSRAFDLCKFSMIFDRLITRNVPPVVVRCLMFMYENQTAWVRWGRRGPSPSPSSMALGRALSCPRPSGPATATQ